MDLDEKKNFIVNFTYIIVWIVILYVVFKTVFIYFLPFFIGLFIAYAIQKPAKFVAGKLKLKKEICAAFFAVVVFVVIITIIVFLVWFVYIMLGKAINYATTGETNIINFFQDIFYKLKNIIKNPGLDNFLKNFSTEAISSLVLKFGNWLSLLATRVIKSLPIIIINCIVTIVATCYISKDYAQFTGFIKGLISEKSKVKIINLKTVFFECFLKLFIGYSLIFLITFFELTIGFFILGVKQFLIVSFFVSLLDLLPVLGTGTVLIPWSVISIFQNEYKFAFGLIFLYVTISLIRNFIEPKIIGKQIDINPIFTLIFMFLGLKLGGFLGLLVLPLVLTVLFTYLRRTVVKNN